MDKLELALELIKEAVDEKQKLDKVSKDMEKLNKERVKANYAMPDYWTRRWQIEGQFGAVPKKAHINDNIKLARRLLMEGRV